MNPHQSKTEAEKTLKDFMDEYIKSYLEPNRPAAQIATSRHIAERHIIPSLGQTRLTQLTPDQIEGMLKQMKAAGLTPSAINKTHRDLTLALRFAVNQGYLQTNPAKQVKIQNDLEGSQ